MAKSGVLNCQGRRQSRYQVPGVSVNVMNAARFVRDQACPTGRAKARLSIEQLIAKHFEVSSLRHHTYPKIPYTSGLLDLSGETRRDVDTKRAHIDRHVACAVQSILASTVNNVLVEEDSLQVVRAQAFGRRQERDHIAG